MILSEDKIKELIEKKELVIQPLLDIKQIGQISIDLRIGYDFLVSIQGRDPYINASRNKEDEENSIEGVYSINHFFQETRRRIGETILLYPQQTVLSSTLEYVRLPNNIMMSIHTRSSYVRLGLSVNTIIQPGYCGCISLELTNNNKNTINLTVGAPIIQAVLHEVTDKTEYLRKGRKYICQVRPKVSMIQEDNDLSILKEIWKNSRQ
ncbi:MAG: dCTP deaminase [Bacteroidetes bacterium]|nr:dCTP deaminase [Bacteroidota bacterium]